MSESDQVLKLRQLCDSLAKTVGLPDSEARQAITLLAAVIETQQRDIKSLQARVKKLEDNPAWKE